MLTADLASPLAVPDRVPILLRDLIHERTGLFFETERFDTMLEKLRDRALFHRCGSYLDYYYILKYEERGPEEWRRVMDAFSVQETYFWREQSQIRALADAIVPRWLERSTGPLRIWSAACASGEEPFSLVIALREAGLDQRDIELHASDASEAALARAARGVYRERSFRALPPELREKYFTRVADGWQIAPEIKARVRFRQANLIQAAEIAGLSSAAVVFCRNVFIYFSPESIKRTLALMSEAMPDHGHLFVGSSESLLRLTEDFALREIGDAFVYVRQPRAIAPPA